MIDAKGKVLMPGLIDAHWHSVLNFWPISKVLNADFGLLSIAASKAAGDTLRRGFSTVRDAGGNVFPVKKATDAGLTDGPRVYPSGPYIGQTSGHGDFRGPNDVPENPGAPLDYQQRVGNTLLADRVPKVIKRTREALRMGASQIKIAVGGGTGSYADPLEVTEFTPGEIKAAVQAASDYGTYVMAHVYNDDGIKRAIDNGVKCIEHGNLVSEKTLQYMKEHEIWLSPQVIVFTFIPHGYTEDQANKHRQAYAGIDNMFKAAKKIGYDKIVFGSDIITDPEMLRRINEEFVHRTKWFTPSEILVQATSKGGELLAMSGPKNPHPGKLGVIEGGAYADVLLINGDPLKDISILTKPEENLALIMKDGKIYKKTL